MVMIRDRVRHKVRGSFVIQAKKFCDLAPEFFGGGNI